MVQTYQTIYSIIMVYSLFHREVISELTINSTSLIFLEEVGIINMASLSITVHQSYNLISYMYSMILAV